MMFASTEIINSWRPVCVRRREPVPSSSARASWVFSVWDPEGVLWWLFAPLLPCPFSPLPPHLTHTSVKTAAPSVWTAQHSSVPARTRGRAGTRELGCGSAQMLGLGPRFHLCLSPKVGSDRICGAASATTELSVWRVCFCPGQCCPSSGIVKPSKGLCLGIFACVKKKVPCWETAFCIFPWFSVYPPNAFMACIRAVFSI